MGVAGHVKEHGGWAFRRCLAPRGDPRPIPVGREQDHPDFGSGPDGFLVYTDSGHVSVQFMRRDRAPWRAEDDPTDAERSEAARGYGAYAGSYEVDEAAGVVRHHVATALIPNRVGATLTRFFSLEGDRLTLRPAAPAPRRRGHRAGPDLAARRLTGLRNKQDLCRRFRRASSMRCASAASDRGISRKIVSLSFPSRIQPKTSAERASRSARPAT
jgi:hypothetical protein